jgi:hypothetical protein
MGYARSVIQITLSDPNLWFIELHKMTCRYQFKRGGCWRATMSQRLANSDLYDEGLIDNRNARPLTIAFATIVTVWMAAFGIVSVSAQVCPHAHQMVQSAVSLVK